MESLRAAADASAAESRRTLATAETESEALRVEIDRLAAERDAAERARVDSARRASDAETRVAHLRAELASERAAVADRGNEVRALAERLEDARRRYEDDRDDLLADLDADESADLLRRRIVLLAHAVEHAEEGRADALDRVVEERRANAETIKRLKESVKRFYATLSCGDSA